jgi:hypothetical protein
MELTVIMVVWFAAWSIGRLLHALVTRYVRDVYFDPFWPTYSDHYSRR